MQYSETRSPGDASAILFSMKQSKRSRLDESLLSPSVIANSKDPLLAQLNDLGSAAGRKGRSQFLAEGLLLVQRALEDRLAVDWIVYTSDLMCDPSGGLLLEDAKQAGIRCVSASEGLLGKVTTSRPVPDVTAVINLLPTDAKEAFTPDLHTILIAENINNPDNLGMILRTADAAGARQVITAGCDPFHKNSVRAARGAVGRIAIHSCQDIVDYIRFLKKNEVTVVGTALDADCDLYNAPLKQPIAVIVGNENAGITREALDACTLRVRIPMAVGQDSLNVGVAAGVVLYEIYRRSLCDQKT
jgi:TrmH family RNA methyltransferase